MIRPIEITLDSITLGRVSRSFVAAVETSDAPVAHDDRDRGRRKDRDSEEFYDPDARRPKQLPREGYQDKPPEE